MEDKLDKILSDLTELKKGLAMKPPSWLERVLWAIEKMLVPLAIAALAFYGHMAATKISEGQLALASASLEDRKEEFRLAMQGKYVELFYSDISSGNQERQSSALELLRLMEPALAIELAQFVEANAQVSRSIRDEAEAKTRQIEDTMQRAATTLAGPLTGYVIGVYFLAEEPESSRSADAIRDQLVNTGLGATVRLYPRTADFFASVAVPTSLEVRFEQGVEDSQAQAILAALSKQPVAREARPRPVGSRTPNFLSVFVPSGG